MPFAGSLRWQRTRRLRRHDGRQAGRFPGQYRGIRPSGNKYGFDVVMRTGQTYTQSDYAGIFNWSVIRNTVPNPLGVRGKLC